MNSLQLETMRNENSYYESFRNVAGLKERLEKIEEGTAEWRKDIGSMKSETLDTAKILKVVAAF
jgi:hypothetical protein